MFIKPSLVSLASTSRALRTQVTAREIPNRFSTVSANDNDHIKFIVCANPKDIFSEFGKAMKPADGWDRLPMAQRRWVSEEDWAVLSLNAMDHENVKQKQIVYKGFVTWEGVQLWLKRCHMDDQHPDMYTYVYGKFPPQGTTRAVVAANDLRKSEREWVFDGRTCAPLQAFTEAELSLLQPMLTKGIQTPITSSVDATGQYCVG